MSVQVTSIATALFFGFASLATPLWAKEPPLPKDVGSAYNLLLEMVTDYPADLHDLAHYFPDIVSDPVERYNQSRPIREFPELDDPWRGSFSIFGNDKTDMFTMISCERIGQETLTHMRNYFAEHNDPDTLSQSEKSQLFLVEQLEHVPASATAVQVCHLYYPLPSTQSEQQVYDQLLTAIGDSFIDTNSATKRQELQRDNPDKYTDYFLNGTGNLHMNGAVVTTLDATVGEKPEGSAAIPVWLMAVSYLLPVLS